MKKGAFNHDPRAQFRARELRASMSVSEKRLWSFLRKEQLGFAFRTQVRVDKYFLDFYCSRAKLCVEVDGEQHSAQAVYDAERDGIIRQLGIETIRVPSLDLFQPDCTKLNEWLKLIETRCRARRELFEREYKTRTLLPSQNEEMDGQISTPQPPSSKTNHFEEWGSGDKA